MRKYFSFFFIMAVAAGATAGCSKKETVAGPPPDTTPDAISYSGLGWTGLSVLYFSVYGEVFFAPSSVMSDDGFSESFVSSGCDTVYMDATVVSDPFTFWNRTDPPQPADIVHMYTLMHVESADGNGFTVVTISMGYATPPVTYLVAFQGDGASRMPRPEWVNRFEAAHPDVRHVTLDAGVHSRDIPLDIRWSTSVNGSTIPSPVTVTIDVQQGGAGDCSAGGNCMFRFSKPVVTAEYETPSS